MNNDPNPASTVEEESDKVLRLARGTLRVLEEPLTSNDVRQVRLAVEALALTCSLVIGGYFTEASQEEILGSFMDHVRSYLPEVTALRVRFESETADTPGLE